MAGARVEITVDDAELKATLGRAIEALGTEGMAPLLGELGEYLLGTTRDRAATETGPDGEEWPALSPRYARRKQKLRPGLPMLVFDRHMLGDRLAWQIVGDTLLVGTSAPYGARQQFGDGEGDRGIKARPWLGVSHADGDGIKARTLDFLKDVFEGGESPSP